MPLDSLPLVGQLGVMGIPLIIVVWVIWAILSGMLVTRRHVEQVQTIADSWQRAWEKGQETQETMANHLAKMVALADTLEHLIDSLPKPPVDGEDV